MAQTLTGAPVGDLTPAAQNIRIPGSKVPFLLLHHAMNGWDVVDLIEAGVPDVDEEDRYEWVPTLRTMWLRPGVDGVREDPVTKALDWSQALYNQTTAGWTHIPQSAGPSGDYMRRLSGVYHDAWTSFDVIGPGIAAVPRFDDLGYLQWRRKLVADGIIAPPIEPALIAKKATIGRRISRNRRKVNVPGAAEAVAVDERKVATPAVKPKRTPKSKGSTANA